MLRTTLIFLCLLLAPTLPLQAEELLKTQSSWDGGEVSYPSGTPEITSVILTIEEGKTTPFHCHPIPTLGYILNGTVEVETQDGKKVILEKGQSAVEVMRTVHRGKALKDTVKILVFYAGSTDIPNTVLPEQDTEHLYCNPTAEQHVKETP